MVYFGYITVHVFNEDHIVLHLTRILNLKHIFALKHKPITIDVMEITLQHHWERYGTDKTIDTKHHFIAEKLQVIWRKGQIETEYLRAQSKGNHNDISKQGWIELSTLTIKFRAVDMYNRGPFY